MTSPISPLATDERAREPMTMFSRIYHPHALRPVAVYCLTLPLKSAPGLCERVLTNLDRYVTVPRFWYITAVQTCSPSFVLLSLSVTFPHHVCQNHRRYRSHIRPGRLTSMLTDNHQLIALSIGLRSPHPATWTNQPTLSIHPRLSRYPSYREGHRQAEV